MSMWWIVILAGAAALCWIGFYLYRANRDAMTRINDFVSAADARAPERGE